MLSELLDVALLDLAHQFFAAEKIIVEEAGDLARDDDELIVSSFGERDGAARGNEMSAPLKHETEIPGNETDEKRGGGERGGTEGGKFLGEALEKNGEADYEENGERNEKTIAEGRDARPVRIRGDEIVEGENGAEDRAADTRRFAPEKENADGGEEENRRPGKEAVIGGEKDLEEVRRLPIPARDGHVAGFEERAINDFLGEQSGEKTDEERDGENDVANEKRGNGGSAALLDGVAQSEERFGCRQNEEHGVGVIDVEHEAGDEAEENPLRDGAAVASAQPVREEDGDDESGVGVGPGGIEVHVDGERAAAPNGEGGEESPTFGDELFGETKGEEEGKETVERRAKGHRVTIRRGETVGGDAGPEGASGKNATVGDEKERRPKDGGANGEMIFKMAGGRAEISTRLAGFVEAPFAETGVGVLIIGGEIEIVLNEESACVRVITDAVTADPRVGQGQSKEKQEHEEALRGSEEAKFAENAGVIFHERSICPTS